MSLDCDADSYVLIPTVVQDPTRVPLPQSGHVPRRSDDASNQLDRPQIESHIPPLEHTSSSVLQPHLDHTQPSTDNLFHMNYSTLGDTSHIDPSSSVTTTNTELSLSRDTTHIEPALTGDTSDIDPSMDEYYNGHTTLTGKASILSDDYDDVIIIPQVNSPEDNCSVAICNNTSSPYSTNSQEMRVTEVVTCSPPMDDYICMKPTTTSLFTPPHCSSPVKPLIKPRKNKPTFDQFSRSTSSQQSDHYNHPQTVSNKSHTLPSQHGVSSRDVFSPDSAISLLSPSSLDDSVKANSTQNTATSFPMPPEFQPYGRTLVHSPLTPPIPRPRQTFTSFKSVPSRAEDDSMIGRSSTRIHHRLSPPLPTHNVPVTDL